MGSFMENTMHRLDDEWGEVMCLIGWGIILTVSLVSIVGLLLRIWHTRRLNRSRRKLSAISRARSDTDTSSVSACSSWASDHRGSDDTHLHTPQDYPHLQALFDERRFYERHAPSPVLTNALFLDRNTTTFVTSSSREAVASPVHVHNYFDNANISWGAASKSNPCWYGRVRLECYI